MSDKFFVLSFSEWNKFHPHDPPEEADRRRYILRRLLQQIESLNPAGIISACGSEVDLAHIYDDVFKLLEPWCKKNNKNFYIFSPAKPYDYNIEQYKHVIWTEFQGYDLYNFHEIVQYYNAKRPIATEPQKLFTCYNNRPELHRTLMVDQLARFDLLFDGIVTYKHMTEILVKTNPNFVLEEYFKYYKGFPILVDDAEFVLHKTFLPNDVPKSYLDGLVDIVTESRFENTETFLSEKTSRPLMTQKPFLVVSCQHYHKWLTTKGIEPYTEIFDYSFDDCPTIEKRVEGIIENLLKLRTEYRTPEDYKNLLLQLKPKLEHNLNEYLKHTASGHQILQSIPFEWMFTEDHPSVIEKHLCREQDFDGEFCAIHTFIHHIVKPYREGRYQLPNISV